MALDFPASPIDGEVYENYQWDDAAGVWNLVPSLVQARYVVSPTAPINPKPGDAWFNSVDAVTYIYYEDDDGAQWVQTGSPQLGYLDLDTLNDVELTAPQSGQSLVYDGANWVNNFSDYTVEYLVIAGGGGGGRGDANNNGSGGGAGGYRLSFGTERSGNDGASEPLFSVFPGTYPITVGAGGSGGASTYTRGANGGDSRLFSFISIGGGGGGAVNAAAPAGANGGSGGGSGDFNDGREGGRGVPLQGFKGGNGQSGSRNCGGGGGAGGPGAPASSQAGGPGVSSSITGSAVTRAVGGDGSSSGGSASANTGSGGNGNRNSAAGNGGSGIIVFRIATAASVTFSGGVTSSSSTSGSETIYTITAAGPTDTVTIS
jgi:hypothetical protein